MSAPFLCWDIDGTLLTTDRAGVYALEKATLAVTRRPLDLQAMPTAGLTDVEIARLIIAKAGMMPRSELIEEFLRIYEDDLPASLPRRAGRVMPGVVAILEALRERPTWGSMLLTGNTRRGAQAKLAHYGLTKYFTDGAFSDGTKDRADIARRAAEAIARSSPAVPLTYQIVIGDTPHDIACANAVGMRVIAVATGGYSVDELRKAGAEAVFAVLPAAEDFFSAVQSLCHAGTPASS
jgi:phosphoglycolate phosphatase